MDESRTTARRTALSLALGGVALAAYPALRPYGPESGLEGAADLGSTAWLAAHVLGMVGFVAIALGLRVAAVAPPWRWTGRPVREAESRAWLAVALLLPYYGAEAYGLKAVGRHATGTGDAAVLDVAGAFRYAPFEVTSFTLGLLLLTVVGGRLAHGLWNTGTVGRVGGLLAGLGLATYLPQFFGTPGMRVGHGVVLGLGLVLAAAAAVRSSATETAPAEQHVAAGAPALSRP